MSKRHVQCLKRVGENVKKHKFIILEDKDEVTIGRNPDVTVCLLSDMISRCHAVLKKTEKGAWLIRDNKSLNGVYINDNRLEPMKPCELKEGDMVRLGVVKTSESPPEFLFQYYNALKMMIQRPRDAVDGAPAAKRAKANNSEAQAVKPGVPDTGQPTRKTKVTGSRPDPSAVASPSKVTQPGQSVSPYLQYRQKLDKQDEEAQAKMKEFEKKLQEMQKLLQEKESEQQAMAQQLQQEKQARVKEVETLQQKEERLKQEFTQKQERLSREKAEMESRLKEELEDLLHVREANLMENLEAQRQGLMNEKKKIEERLTKELESEREKDKKLTEELMQQKKNLEKVIENKEVERRLLESQLSDTRQEKDKQHEEMLRAREDVLSNFAQLMETELQCSICNELFVKATSLNCSHAFCSYCISQWMRVKKECPQCRAAITTHMRSIVLDSYIDKMVEQFSDDMKKARQEFVNERKDEEAAFEAANKPQPPPARGRGRGGRARGRGRGRGGGRRGLMDAPPPLPEAPPSEVAAPIFISDNDEDSDVYQSLSSSNSSEGDPERDSDDSDSIELSGDERVYFGGYGRCFSCGARGHWANGCPYR